MRPINFFSDRSLYTQTNVPCVRDKNWAQTVVRGLLHAMADLWPAKQPVTLWMARKVGIQSLPSEILG